MPRDYEREVTIKGFDGTDAKTVRVDINGQLYTLMVGANNVIVAVDDDGNISSVMQGQHGGALRTLLTDDDGRLIAQLMGMYGSTPVPVAVNAVGSLSLSSLTQSSIEPDPIEARTWDDPTVSLVNNLNRIRWMLVSITGEAWGTVSRSLTAIWTLFSASTGHAHSGAADDGKPIHHGDTTGLTDYDHDQYLRKNLSQAVTGDILFRNTNSERIGLIGSELTDGSGAFMLCFGANHPWYPGEFHVAVPNAAKTGFSWGCRILGCTNTPALLLRGNQIKEVGDPTDAQDAATKKYADASGGPPAGAIIMWSGSIATIPSGWLLCSGANSTPNLRDRFVIGAGSSYAVGATGGSATHALTVAELALHAHTLAIGDVNCAAGAVHRAGLGGVPHSTGQTGSGTAHENRPPYFALAYIMKT